MPLLTFVQGKIVMIVQLGVTLKILLALAISYWLGNKFTKLLPKTCFAS